MFLGHFALAFAAKRLAPRVSLGILFLAAQWADLLWPLLLLTGAEEAVVVPGREPLPLVFVSYPWSHSLLLDVVWGMVAATLVWSLSRDRRAAVVVGLLVVSHWFLDLLVHVPDLPLWPGGPLVGLGLWRVSWLVLVLELAALAAGVGVYVARTAASGRAGSVGLWTLVVFLLIAHLLNTFGGAPPSVQVVALVTLSMWVLLPWAWWADRHRTVPPRGDRNVTSP